ncbi:MAG: adenine phosphoribosyltransferase [Synechococcaceae cyanobacterium]|nr:adenine phosphoribosyltransferase [Synechococcaceae cyanobacterium]
MSASASIDLRNWVRDVPDFPRPGILFRDLTPLMRDPQGWTEAMRQLSLVCEELQPDMIVGIEARGFLFGMGLATRLGLGFVPVRKAGKLPGEVIGVSYALEYGEDRLEIVADALQDGPKVLVVDDLLATGGTAAATAELVGRAGGRVCGFGFVIELAALQGRHRLPGGSPVASLITYS